MIQTIVTFHNKKCFSLTLHSNNMAFYQVVLQVLRSNKTNKIALRITNPHFSKVTCIFSVITDEKYNYKNQSSGVIGR